jgi:NSS family neurotransmitter:Na+ symporter
MPAVACFLAGLATVLSFNRWADWYPLAGIPGFAQATVFDLVDHATSNALLPLGGCALAVFAGWALPRAFLAAELGLAPGAAARLHWVLKYVAPAGIAAAALAPLWIRG